MSKRWESQLGSAVKRYPAVASTAPAVRCAKESMPNLSARGRRLMRGDHVGDALGEFVGEVIEVAEDGREASGEEEGEDGGDGGDQKDNGDAAGRLVAAEIEPGDAADSGHEDDCEESADVEDQKLFLEGPGEGRGGG